MVEVRAYPEMNAADRREAALYIYCETHERDAEREIKTTAAAVYEPIT
jgi:hypothetical protein